MKTLTKLLAGVTLTICTVGAANASGYNWNNNSYSNSYHHAYNQPYSVSVAPQHHDFKVVDLNQTSQINDYRRMLTENTAMHRISERKKDRQMWERIRQAERADSYYYR